VPLKVNFIVRKKYPLHTSGVSLLMRHFTVILSLFLNKNCYNFVNKSQFFHGPSTLQFNELQDAVKSEHKDTDKH